MESDAVEDEYDVFVVEPPFDDEDFELEDTIESRAYDDAVPERVEPEKTRGYYFPDVRVRFTTSSWNV